MHFIREVYSNYPETVVIIMTPVDDPKILEDALELGACGYIIKPFNDNELVLAVGNALRLKKLELEKKRLKDKLESPFEKERKTFQKGIYNLSPLVRGEYLCLEYLLA